MKRISLMMALALMGGVMACDTDVPDADPLPTPPVIVDEVPDPPQLGAQIDRVGRPAANTALNNTFNPDTSAKEAAKDAYNDAAPGSWSTFADEIAANLAIVDSLDAQCGNQLLAAESLTSDRYARLAGVLADDKVYLNTASTSCGQYLAVEANFLGITNTDCGGRMPAYDVIDTTYSVLAIGELEGVTDGVEQDGDGAIHPTSEFPFLAPPVGSAQ